MITEFGKLLRIIRINTGDSARTMAEKFGMSPSYLSTIETESGISRRKWRSLSSGRTIFRSTTRKTAENHHRYHGTVEGGSYRDGRKEEKVIFSLTKGNIDEETLNQLCEIIDKSRFR